MKEKIIKILEEYSYLKSNTVGTTDPLRDEIAGKIVQVLEKAGSGINITRPDVTEAKKNWVFEMDGKSLDLNEHCNKLALDFARKFFKEDLILITPKMSMMELVFAVIIDMALQIAKKRGIEKTAGQASFIVGYLSSRLPLDNMAVLYKDQDIVKEFWPDTNDALAEIIKYLDDIMPKECIEVSEALKKVYDKIRAVINKGIDCTGATTGRCQCEEPNQANVPQDGKHETP